MRKTYRKDHQWNALCDICGFKRKSTQLVARWDGLMVCAPVVKQGCWEPKHPQLFIRPIRDQAPLPWTRPEPEDVFIESCSAIGRQGIAGYAVGDCAIAEFDLGIRDTPTFI